MPLTRREFLTKLATIAVVAPILPKLVETNYIAPVIPDLKQPPLTLAMLEEAYQACTFGYQEPDMIMMSPDTYAEFMGLWNALPNTFRFMRDDKEIELPTFNGASITFCKALPKGSWIELNSDLPKEVEPKYHERFSGIFYKYDIKWHPIPKEL